MTIAIGRILFAFASPARPAPELRWVGALARALGIEMHVLAVLEDDTGSLARPSRGYFRALKRDGRVLAMCRDLRAWCAATLGNEWSAERFTVRLGPLEREIAGARQDVVRPLVAIPAGMPGSVRAASILLRSATTPVLLVGDRRLGCEAVVAATDLEDERLPVLNLAAALAGRVAARLLLFHNVEPLRAAGVELANERLQAIRRVIEPRPSALISTRSSAGDAILQASESVSANLVVVGARRRSWLEQLTRGRPEYHSLIAEAGISVLVLPLEDAIDEGLGPFVSELGADSRDPR